MADSAMDLVYGVVVGATLNIILAVVGGQLLGNVLGKQIKQNVNRCAKYKANPVAFKRCTGGVCLNCTHAPCANGLGEPNSPADMEKCLYT